MGTATGQTCNGTFDLAHARKITTAIWTRIKIASYAFADREWKVMTALLVANPKIAASLPPFKAMWQDPASARTKLRQDVRQLVPQSSLDFGGMMNEVGIQ